MILLTLKIVGEKLVLRFKTKKDSKQAKLLSKQSLQIPFTQKKNQNSEYTLKYAKSNKD